jgi:hypothetical protein
MTDMKALIGKLGAILAFTTLILGGCGGGGGGGGGVSPPPPPPPTGGITRTGVAVAAGPITGFGSVIVNGVTYDTSTATFTRDGDPSTQAEFKVGETVIVKGTIDDDNTNAVAESVELDEIVKGPVSAVTGTVLTVMGQTVNAGDRTSIDDSCNVTLADLSPLLAVFAVEVYGSVDGNGDIEATRIECKAAGEIDEFEVNGIVSDHVPGTSFMIKGLLVNYASALSIDNFPGGVINDGDPVEAEGPPANFDDSGMTPVLTASKVEYKGNVLDGNEGDHFEVDGFITDFVSITQFSIRVGSLVIPVTTDPNLTTYEGGTAGDLADNLKIEVEGEDDGTGTILATKIEIKSSTNIRVTGLVDAGSVGTNTFRILDIVINTDPTRTRFEDKRDVPTDPTVIAADQYIEVRGQEQPQGQITAFIVERDDFDPTSDDTELRGFIEPNSVSGRNSFVILGVTVDTSNE